MVELQCCEFFSEVHMIRLNCTGALTALSSAGLLGGMLTFASPCPAVENHPVQSCFWAARSITGMSAVLLFLSVLHMLLKNPDQRLGLDFGLIAVSSLTMLAPNILIELCSDIRAHCHGAMELLIFGLSLLMLTVSFADLLIQFRNSRRKNSASS